jgi:aspartate kinase
MTIVMKFGGTSVGSAERIRAVGDRVRERKDRRPVVVVSALSGITDLLIRGAHAALARDEAADAALQEIRERHDGVLRALVPEGPARDRLLVHLDEEINELRTLYTGVRYLGELTPRSLDAISGMGERLSFEIVAEALQAQGVPACAFDARQVLITDEGFGRALPLMEQSRERVERLLKPLIEQGQVPIVPGFIGATQDGITTTLGRGGSDWSAAILGALLPADEIQIWTDVDGIMTVDPRAVPGARVIPEVAFEEAAELAYFGAKVLHPATIKPAIEKGIPVFILNSLNPTAPGTRIAGRVPEGVAGEPRAIAFKKGITVVLISQPRMLMAHGFVARVFEVFDRHRTPVDLIATSEVSVSLTIDDAARLPAIQADLGNLGEVRVLSQMAIVSVVGRGFIRQPGLAGRIFQTLQDVNVVMISFGASDVNVSFVVSAADAEKAVRLLHREFFEGAQQRAERSARA